MLTVRKGLLALLLNLILLSSCDKPTLIMYNVTPTIVSPKPYQILQRDQNNTALVPIDVQASTGTVYATFEPIQGGKAVKSVKIGTLVNGRVTGAVALTGGDYRLTIEVKEGDIVAGSQTVNRVGVGEVFVIFGHSVASGNETPIYDNPDERVRVANFRDPNLDESKLPDTFSPLTATSSIGPFGGGPYAWGPFGNKMAAQLNVPILLFNSAFGGSQLLQSYKVIKQIPFDHSFVKYADGMPYRALKAALTKYIPKTGCRAILVHHGINDRNEVTREQFAEYYKTVIEYSRSTFNLGELPFVLAMEDGGAGNNVDQVRAATQDVLNSVPGCYPGADLLALRAQRAGREDTIHLLPSDWDAYATLWYNAVLPIINKKPLQATLGTEFTGNVVNGSLLTNLAMVTHYLPTGQNVLLAMAVGVAVALVVARKPIPALIALCLVMFGIGRKVENKVLRAKQITQIG